MGRQGTPTDMQRTRPHDGMCRWRGAGIPTQWHPSAVMASALGNRRTAEGSHPIQVERLHRHGHDASMVILTTVFRVAVRRFYSWNVISASQAQQDEGEIVSDDLRTPSPHLPFVRRQRHGQPVAGMLTALTGFAIVDTLTHCRGADRRPGCPAAAERAKHGHAVRRVDCEPRMPPSGGGPRQEAAAQKLPRA